YTAFKVDQILSNRWYRNLFFLCTALLAISAILTRYYLLPKWDPALAQPFSTLIAQLLEGFVATLVVTMVIGCYLFIATPRVMSKAKFEAVEPRAINSLLREAVLQGQKWDFRGGTGRFTRTETLPALAKRARVTSSR